MRIDWLGTLKMRERKMQDWNLVTNKYGTTNMDTEMYISLQTDEETGKKKLN